jgi:type I restriction-modification system DNA methylase subunit
MPDVAERIRAFLTYVKSLKGDEKGEAQVFADRLFLAFGHAGYKEAGAVLEERISRKGRSTGFADLLWRPRLLLEMKSRGEKLQRHYQQAFDYWLNATPNRPSYVILCNFDEFWIYDFNSQLHEPVDRILLEELPDRYTALNFLFPENRKPLFNNDRVAVTRDAADKVAQVFNAIVARGEERERAQRFILQSVVAMFSEDFELLPRGLFSELLDDCLNGANTFNLLGGLFQQMNTRERARGGKFNKVAYFNGGLFKIIDPIDMVPEETQLLLDAANENWSKVAPPIFGTLFQSSMGKERRHALGAYFTSEADIQKVIRPTIVRPWRERIQNTDTLKELLQLSDELLTVRVLDPACGSGNFLYIAYRELVNLEMEILAKIHENFGARARRSVGTASLISTKQLYGIDRDDFAVELAKVTLMLGKRLALAEVEDNWFSTNEDLPFEFEEPLPLDNLDDYIICDDALHCGWPTVDYIVGNPPYQSKNKMVEEFGRDYVDEVRKKFPGVPGRVDYCVYWLRKSHDHLQQNGRAGLVGTNTIRQTYSRQGGLEYIVDNGGTITEAVSTQVWSGDAVVHVSIVNWVKGDSPGMKKLFFQDGDFVDSPWSVYEMDYINAALSVGFDVTKAIDLEINAASQACYQGQTHGHAGFLLTPAQSLEMKRDASSADCIHPYLIGDDLLGEIDGRPSRYVIDLNHCKDLHSAMQHKLAFRHLEKYVMPDILANAEKERESSKKETGPRQSHAKRWWKFWRAREEMIDKISAIPRYIACSRTTRRPIFDFIESRIRPNDALQIFPLSDDYSFGILQSSIHTDWFAERCSTLKRDPRYTSNTVFDSFPWPQAPTIAQVREIADRSRELRIARRRIIAFQRSNLRELYRTLETPGKNELADLQAELGSAVRAAYGMRSKDDPLQFLFELNKELAELELNEDTPLKPGLPDFIADADAYVSDDAIRMPN